MKLRYKIANSLLAVVIASVAILAFALSRTDDCVAVPQATGAGETMHAVVHTCYGPPEVLQYAVIAKPVPADDEVLVKVVAASVNPLDWHYMRGSPFLMRLSTGLGSPDTIRTGVDFSGIVEKVGAGVTRFKPGDPVFGGRDGAFADYLTIRADRAIVHKPPGITHEQAASVGIAAVTALQSLRDKARLQPGQTVLINGASGGVGTFAVQIAKAMGANVTGVCSARNVGMVYSIGADRVIDYHDEDYTKGNTQYDVIIDMVGNQSLMDNRKVLKANGIYVMVGGAKGDWVGPLWGPIKTMLLNPFVDQEFSLILAQLRPEDLQSIAAYIQEGKVVPVIDSRYALRNVAAAIAHSENGHASGKILISVADQDAVF